MRNILLTLFILFLIKNSYSDTFLIIQKENAIVRDSVVLLQNIADIEAKNPLLLQELKNLVIGETPSLGLTRSFSKYDIIKSLRKNDYDSREFDFLGANKTLVEQYAVFVSEDEIITKAKPIIEDYLELASKDLLIELRTNIPKIAFKEGTDINFRFNVIPNRNFTGNLLIDLDLISGSKIERNIKLSFQVKIIKEVYVSNKNIQKGETINENDIILKLNDVTKEYGNGIFTKNEIIGKVAEREIITGSIFNEKNISSKLLIKRKKLIDMFVENGRLNISVRGEALENGSLGDTIKAKNIDTGVIVYGEIIDNNTIRVK